MTIWRKVSIYAKPWSRAFCMEPEPEIVGYKYILVDPKKRIAIAGFSKKN